MSYSELVREAFIEPIRSVLIVDDEYPTWDSILSGSWSKELDKNDKATEKWNTNGPRLLKTVLAFRDSSPSMIIDMDDGSTLDSTTSIDIAKHLHQSDLLILDYQLDGSEGDGDKSIGLASKILENEHFNLIVVHTTADRVNEAFENLVISLISEIKNVPKTLVTQGQVVLRQIAMGKADDTEDANELEEVEASIVEELKTKYITASVYLHCYFKSDKLGIFSLRELTLETGPLGPYCEHSKNALKLSKLDTMRLGAYILHEIGSELSKKFSKTKHNSLSCSDRRINESVSWIRSSKGFIAFADKSDPTSLMEVLQNALEHWGPTPSRLLSARMRSEIDRQGVVAEDEIFSDNLVFRKFYEGLSSKDEKNTNAKKRVTLESQIKRHMESLGDQSAETITAFGMKILESDNISDDKPHGFIGDYGKTSPEDLASSGLKYNAYICSKEPSGPFISTGQIFTLTDQNNTSSDYWVCLSPLCDMVPKQRRIGIENVDNNAKPFFAAKLENIPNAGDLVEKQINSNEYIFLNIDGKISVKSIYANSSTNEGKDPHWRMFVAKNAGWFDDYENGPLATRELDLQWLVSNGTPLTIQCQKVKIEWQLRYEYALNLNQKLGSNLTRVGLDFIS